MMIFETAVNYFREKAPPPVVTFVKGLKYKQFILGAHFLDLSNFGGIAKSKEVVFEQDFL